jgi:uncharacterized protein (DUF488 family)
VAELVERLRENGITLLLDIRYRPQSRKPGFSKTALTASCVQSGIKYSHDPDLGTPPDQMGHVKQARGYDAEAVEKYRAYLHTKTDSLARASNAVQRDRACLLCYEADASNCHRRIVAEELSKRTGLSVLHL